MNILIQPATAVEGTLLVPSSKSYSQRALALAYLAHGVSQLNNIGNSRDECVAVEILRQAGAILSHSSAGHLVDSTVRHSTELSVDCGESGLSARLFTPIFAAGGNPVELVAKGSLLKRPMHQFQSIFDQLQVQYKSSNDHFPIFVQGPFVVPECIVIDGAQSSQYITGLLYALVSSVRDRPVTLVIQNPTSIPYIQLSLEVLAQFGVELKWVDGTIVIPQSAKIVPALLEIEADWSSAAFWVVAAAISGKVTLQGLNQDSMQADRAILSAVRQYGAEVEFDGKDFIIQSNVHQAFTFDATHCPDLFPPLVALAATAEGVSVIHGVHRLFHKESNRALALQEEFAKLGVKIVLEADTMQVYGAECLKGKQVQAHGDHRIAMACAIAILKCNEPISIEGADAVEKSYPDFFKHLAHFGVKSYVDN